MANDIKFLERVVQEKEIIINSSSSKLSEYDQKVKGLEQ